MKRSCLAWLPIVAFVLATGCKPKPNGPLSIQEASVAGKWTNAVASSGGKMPNSFASLLSGSTKFELRTDRGFDFGGLSKMKGKWMLSGQTLEFVAETVDGLTQKGIDDAREALDKKPSTGELFGDPSNPHMTLRMQEETLQGFAAEHRYQLAKDGASFEVPEGDSGPFHVSEHFVREAPVDPPVVPNGTPPSP